MPKTSKLRVYEGREIDVQWDGRLCIHVGECGKAEGELFVSGREPWCDPDEASHAEVVDVVERCPTGALTYRRKDGGEEAPTVENTVVLANNGPLYVRGRIDIEGAPDDMPGVRFRAALCRCGHSRNKPFCDNAHEEAGFSDRGAVGESGPGLEGEDQGPLRIQRAPNGPLIANGPFTIVTAAGRRAWSGKKAALCRCGASAHKPFCDGSHREAGFRAD